MGVCRICQGGPTIFFWGGGANCDAWRSHAFARGFGGMVPRKKFLNGAIWCVMEHIFIIFLLSKSLILSFFFFK